MSESIDWRDPSRLQRRDGGTVIACGRTATGANGEEFWAVTESPQGGPVAALYWKCGRYTMGIDCDRDIIGRPREPRHVDRWVDPMVFMPSSGLFRHYNKPYGGLIRVRITEVIE
jgi:hypothetical protein